MREKLCFDSGWQFHRGDMAVPEPTQKSLTYMTSKTERVLYGPAAYHYRVCTDMYGTEGLADPTPWEEVTLPHDYVIEGVPNKEENQALGYLRYENAWYRKTFRIEESDRNQHLTLCFDGVATHATVYVNGSLMGHNFCGYTSFEIDITDVVRYNEDNVVAVYVQSDTHEGWWYQGGGIYRHVWLKKTGFVAVDQYGVWINPKKLSGTTWRVPVETTVRNDDFTSHSLVVTNEIWDPDGVMVATASVPARVDRKYKKAVTTSMDVLSPALWDTEHPRLYTLRTTITSKSGKLLDEYTETFGFRTIEYTGEGFRLNGKKTVFKGVCCHQDYGITGKAMPDNIHRYRLRLMKEMGANALRTSHYPNAWETMEACDRLGLMVMDETRWFESTKEGLEQLEMLIKRDRNRPCVVMWSIGNEEPLHVKDQGRRIAETMYAFAKRLDDSRPIMTAISNAPETATVNEVSDIIGVNYNLQAYDLLHGKYPNKSILSSECCATGTTRGWYLPNDDGRARVYAYDRDTNKSFLGREHTWKYFMERPWMIGEFQWAGIEHRGETAWPRLCSVSGALDLYLIKKDAFWQNKSHWTKEPMVHLLPHWNLQGREGETIPVWVYNNCEEVELWQDGVSLGKQKMQPYDHAAWDVVYHPGEMKAVGYRGGKIVCSEVQKTTGPAVKLRLELQNGEDVAANGSDLAVIHCICLDSEDRQVPDAAPTVSFTTNGLGKVVGTGSDNTDHIPPQCPDRKMWAGVCACAVGVGTQPGVLKVYAHAEGLQTAALEIELK